MPSFTDFPRELGVVKTYKAVIAAFPGAPTPAQVVIKAPDVRAASVQAGIRRLRDVAVATGLLYDPVTQVASAEGDTVVDVRVPIAGNGDNAASLDALRTLRTDVLPQTLGKLANVEYAVTGDTAGTADFNQRMKDRMPWVIAFRARARVPAAPDDVPLGRHPAHRDRPQPAVGGRRVRAARAHLPAHVGG